MFTSDKENPFGLELPIGVPTRTPKGGEND